MTPPYVARISVAGKPAGSAILVRPDILLTCHHVVEQAGPRQQIEIEINGKAFRVTCPSAQRDKANDLALLRLPEPLDDVEIPLLSDSDATGTKCEYVAFPEGNFRSGEAEIKASHSDYFEINIAFRRGSSGGAVIRSRAGRPHYVGLIFKGEASWSEAKNKAALEAFLQAHGVLPGGENSYDPERYFEDLRAETRWIELRDLGVDPKDTDAEPGMDVLYHPLMTVAGGGMKEPKRILLEDALPHKRLVIIGGPGSGKTTFLRRIAWALCREDRANEKLKLPFGGFPLWVRVPELDEHIAGTTRQNLPRPTTSAHPDWIAHFLAARPSKLPAQFFASKLSDPESVLLIDGLDEASNATRRATIDRMIAAAAASFACRIVVTTRPGAAETETSIAGFQTVRIADWERPEIEAFCRRWSAWLKGGGEAGRQWGKYMMAEVSATDRRLRANPMMLTALAVIYEKQNAHLPEERSKLYESIMLWLAGKASQRGGGPGRYSADDCLTRLGRLAMEMQQWKGGFTRRIGIEDAARRIMAEFRRVPEEEHFEAARLFLESAHIRTGIVTLRSKKLEFWHRGFQEFLAGRRLSTLTDRELFERAQALLYSPESREVLPLAAGCLSEGGPDRLDLLLESLIAGAELKDSVKERAHAVGVIGAMLADTRKAYKPGAGAAKRWRELLGTIDAIFDGERGREIPLRTRVEAAEALGAARDLRLHMPREEEYWEEIPGGRFIIGSENEEVARVSLEPHPVELTSFHIGRYPVTVWEYSKYLDDTDAKNPPDWEEQSKHENRPIVRVNWHEAQAYCKWAGSRGEWRVRLPSEEQWEFVARGEEGREYPWGWDKPTAERAHFDDTGLGVPTPVGLFPLGNVKGRSISDMAGNVWEWTESDYDEATKVVRGASFYDGAWDLRAACRGRNVPDDRSYVLGFRCVRE